MLVLLITIKTMSAAISMGSDLKDYVSARNGDKPSLTDNVKSLFNNGNNKAKQWFYQPLSTEDIAADDSHMDSMGDNRTPSSSNSWFSSLSLSSNTQNEANDWLPSLSRTQRVIGFISTFYIPLLVFKARKFALLFTFGSLFIVLSFSVLWGPISHMKHLFSQQRLPFTLTYFGSLFMTLYFALKVQSTVLTALFAVIQVIALLWYVVSYLPGGQTGLMFFTKIATKAAAKGLPV
ncbi:unnamed protein product [Medioppia subpectinata]|uniref:Vesicle transport protein n=1 Tax=Medioppia subpectinata TaxID=1979941 RepID=A0A7R9KR12_9ACAR|nr:unnamed protein product [Medioppia subpectinata]CAG2108218.1 unnamed protein product [Medioppia subpectinata]